MGREGCSDRPFNLIGHSMGAAISLGFAGTNPDMVKRLVLADAAGILHRHAFGEYMLHLGFTGGVPGLDKIKKNPFGRALGAAFSAAIGEAAEKIAHQIIRPYFSVEPNPATVFRLAKVRRKLLGGDPMKISGLMLVTHNFGPAIVNVAAPPLLVWGMDDKIAPLRTGRMLESLIPGARFEPIAECGHVVMKEKAGRFNELVLAFLAEEPRRPGDLLEQSTDEGEPAEDRTVRRESGRVIEGRFGALALKGCKDMILEGVRAKRLEISDSTCDLRGCAVDGDDVALDVADSRLKITGGSLRADVAVWTEESDLDFAGTRISGSHAAVRTGLKGQVLFSVCPVESPKNRGFLHGVYPVSPEEDI